MKANAIVRIVIFSLVILILLGLLAAGLGIGSLVFNFDISNQEYITGGSTVDIDQIQKLEIEWASGSITINTADVPQITFQETGSGINVPEMVYRIENGTLKILYSKPSVQIGFFSLSDKDLQITVPAAWECTEYQIEAASANVTLNGVKSASAEIDTASGTCTFNECSITALDIDAASGDIFYTGMLSTLSCDAASADVTAVLQNTPQRISMDSASGDLVLTLPADCGFTASLESLSGNFQSEFSTTKVGKSYVCGDGACQIEMDCASGSIHLRKGE